MALGVLAGNNADAASFLAIAPEGRLAAACCRLNSFTAHKALNPEDCCVAKAQASLRTPGRPSGATSLCLLAFTTANSVLLPLNLAAFCPKTAERCWSGRTGLPAKQLYWQNRYRGFESPPLRHAFYFQIAYRLFKRVFAFCCPKILHPVIYLPIKSDM